jgi:hypothetical protein
VSALNSSAAGQPASYAGELARKLDQDCRGQLVAAVLHGSAALGGWQPSRSDVDVLFVVAITITETDLRRMAVSLLTLADECPGSGIEASIVTAAQAAAAAAPWPYLRHIAAGPAVASRIAPAPGSDAHDPDLLMHYAVCRAAGISVHGPPPAAIFGEIPRPAILEYLAGELRWGLDNAPEAYAVLNACRAQVYLTDEQIVSKIAGGELVLARGSGPAELISSALAQQRGAQPARPPGPGAAEFALATAARLAAAAG